MRDADICTCVYEDGVRTKQAVGCPWHGTWTNPIEDAEEGD